jgi:hypothetical protein
LKYQLRVIILHEDEDKFAKDLNREVFKGCGRKAAHIRNVGNERG